MKWWVLAAVVSVGCQTESAPVLADAAPRPPELITNGEEAASCQWPATAALINFDASPYCSATLIHPRFVLTAAHCITIGGMPSSIAFGEDGFAPERSIGVVDCQIHPEFGTGVDVDLAVCELEDAITDVQPVPVLMGCEADALQPAAEVTIVGFGNTQSLFLNGVYWSGEGIGPKRYVTQSIYEVRDEAEEVDFIGIDVMSGGCHGDSGGGAFVQLADGTWRVFGVAQSLWNVPGFEGSSSDGGGSTDPTTGASIGGSDPTTGGNFIDPDTGVAFIDPTGSGGEPEPVCGYGTTYTLVTPRMDWVEEMIGDDVTPCFTTNGTWDPSEACTPFPTQIDQAVGTWAGGCAGELGGEPQCGELPEGSESSSGSSTTSAESSSGPEPDPDGSGTTSTDGTTSNVSNSGPSSSATTPVDPSSSAETSETDGGPAATGDDGCGCRHDAAPRPAFALVLLALLGVRRRRPR